MTHRFGWLCIAVGASGLLLGETPSSSLKVDLKAGLPVERKAASGAPQVPVLGFVARSSPVGLQPVLGSSGAVALGDLIAANDDVTRIVVAPGQQYALAERANSAELGWISLEKGVASDLRLVSGAMSHWDRLAFSSDAVAAVLYSAADQRVQVISGLPSNPQVARSLDLSQLSDLPVTALAVSNDASNVLIGMSDGSTGALWLMAGDAGAKRIANAGNPSAIRFFANNQDALAGDKGLKQILQISISGDQVALRTIAGEAQGVSSPVDLDISANQRRAWAVDTAGLLSIDLDSGATSVDECPYAPFTLIRMAAKSVFLITSEDGDSTGIWSPETASRLLWRLPGKNKGE